MHILPPFWISPPFAEVHERRWLGLTSGHQLCKTFLGFPSSLCFLPPFQCVPNVLCFHCNNKPANITNIRLGNVYWGGGKERKRKEKNAVNVALEPREPTALPRALSPPAPSLSVSAASRQLVVFFFPSPRRWVFRQNALLCNLSLFSSLGETQRVLSLTGAEIKALVGDNCSQFAVWNVCF